MTGEKDPRRRMGAEEILREVVQAYRARYARSYKRIWGVDPPGLRSRRIVFVHDDPHDPENSRRRSLLTARGAFLSEWVPGADLPPSPDHDAHGLLLVAREPRDRVARDLLGRLAGDALGRKAVLAAAGPAVLFLVVEGVLTGRRAAYASDEEELMSRSGVLPSGGPLVQDGPVLTCAAWDRVPDLIRALLDLVHRPQKEGGAGS
jgi:hypothetical protein